MRILWVSDAPDSASGYAVETRLAAPRLAALGHEVALLATYGHHGARREWRGLPIYPGGLDPFANDVIGAAARDWRADIVITLKDSFVFNPQALQGLRWLPMVPVDHEPAPPQVIEVARQSYRPIAYAPNGFRALRAAGLDPLYAPHAYDPALLSPMDKTAARAHLGLPQDAFIVGTVAVNRGGVPSRKAWPQNLEGFARFAAQHSDAIYYLHTWLGADGREGAVNLPLLASQLGVTPRVAYCDQQRYLDGYPDEYMCALYNAMDVLLATSLGEGFGIPTLEAQACGTPVIVSDWAASRDLCFAGWKVSKGLRFYDSQGTWVFLPEPEAVKGALEKAYDCLHSPATKATITRYRQQALSGAAPYAIDRVITDHWQPLLAEVERMITDETSRGVLRIVRPEEVLG